MKELPGDVFVAGQLLAAQMQALAEQGVMTFINNRPDMEGPMQPLSEELEKLALELGVDYQYIPMAGGLTPGLIEARRTISSAPSPAFNTYPPREHIFLSAELRTVGNP